MNVLSDLATPSSSSGIHCPHELVESIKRKLPVRKVGSLKPVLAQLMTDQIDTYNYLAWHSAVPGMGKDWFAQMLTLDVDRV